MKNVKEVVGLPVFKLDHMHGAPPRTPKGWTLKYFSGADNDYKPGYLLSRWSEESEGTVFGFGPPDELITFDNEAAVVGIRDFLRKHTGLESEAIKVG